VGYLTKLSSLDVITWLIRQRDALLVASKEYLVRN